MRRLATVLSALACSGAVAASAYVLTMPADEGIATSTATVAGAASGGDAVRVTRRLAEERGDGSRVWGILLVVTAIATAPPAVGVSRPTTQRATTWAAALLLCAFAVLAGFSIGLFFMPTALTLLAAGVATLFVRDWPARESGRSRGARPAGSPR